MTKNWSDLNITYYNTKKVFLLEYNGLTSVNHSGTLFYPTVIAAVFQTGHIHSLRGPGLAQ
jgi:hypothetical protein